MPTQTTWQKWLERFYNLRRDKSGAHERPHKPVLLLAILDLLDRGLLRTNEIRLSPDLVDTFNRYFEAVRQRNDRPTIQNPFYHLCGDGFWQLVSQPGELQPFHSLHGHEKAQKCTKIGSFQSSGWPWFSLNGCSRLTFFVDLPKQGNGKLLLRRFHNHFLNHIIEDLGSSGLVIYNYFLLKMSIYNNKLRSVTIF